MSSVTLIPRLILTTRGDKQNMWELRKQRKKDSEGLGVGDWENNSLSVTSTRKHGRHMGRTRGVQASEVLRGEAGRKRGGPLVVSWLL